MKRTTLGATAALTPAAAFASAGTPAAALGLSGGEQLVPRDGGGSAEHAAVNRAWAAVNVH